MTLRQANSVGRRTGEKQRVFCASLSDIFDPRGLEQERANLRDEMLNLSWVHLLLLTKRPEHIEQCLPRFWDRIASKVWLGVSIENNAYWNRLRLIQDVPAAVYWVSHEPGLEMLDLFGMAEDMRLDWLVSGGECLDGDTLIHTTRGIVPIREIRPGTEVYSFAGHITPPSDGYRQKQAVHAELHRGKVAHLVVSGRNELFELKARGRKIVASADHRFLRLTRSERPYSATHRFAYGLEWARLAALKRGDMIVTLVRGRDDGSPFPLQYPVQETTADFMKIVGCFIGDGWIIGNRTILFALPEGSPKRVKYVQLVQQMFGYDMKPADNRSIQLGLYDSRAARQFQALGLDRKALEKRVPEWVWGLPVDKKQALMEGYIDADGHCEDNIAVLNSPNRHLIQDMWGLAIESGYRVGVCFPRTRTRGAWEVNGKIYQYGEGVSYVVKLNRARTGYYALEHRRRDHMIASSLGATPFSIAPVQDISSVGFRESFDLQVEGIHNYVANGLVVHNSNQGGVLARRYPVEGLPKMIEQAHARGAAVFVKQMGSHWAREHGIADDHAENTELWPEEFRVREYPQPRVLASSLQ